MKILRPALFLVLAMVLALHDVLVPISLKKITIIGPCVEGGRQSQSAASAGRARPVAVGFMRGHHDMATKSPAPPNYHHQHQGDGAPGEPARSSIRSFVSRGDTGRGKSPRKYRVTALHFAFESPCETQLLVQLQRNVKGG